MAFVYILSSRSANAVYVGSAVDLQRRLEEHRLGIASPFTAKYRVVNLVYFERHETPEAASLRERRIKRWHRAWKEDLIRSMNPTRRDLSTEVPPLR